MSASPFDVALDVRAILGECPVWSVRDRALYFVDIKGATLHRFDPATGAHRAVVQPEEIGCIAAHGDGGFIAGMRSGLWRLDATGFRWRNSPTIRRTRPRAASTTAAAIRRVVSSRARWTNRRPAPGRISTASIGAALRPSSTVSRPRTASASRRTVGRSTTPTRRASRSGPMDYDVVDRRHREPPHLRHARSVGRRSGSARRGRRRCVGMLLGRPLRGRAGAALRSGRRG